MTLALLDHLLDHLWQSTLFALAAALLVLALRRGPAAVRHGLWLAASIKFLIPFAALAAAGAWLAPDVRLPAPAVQAAVLKTAAAPFSQAFAQPQPEPRPAAATRASVPSETPILQARPTPPVAAPARRPAIHIDPVLILLAVWALGSAAILARWTMRWLRVRQAIRAAKPVPWPAPMPVKASSWLIEPGLAGLVNPVLIVPETLPGRLTRSEIDAIVAHETSHLRRKDNLTAALHMLVEALFWFHPLVWWIGARMIVEREQACDEAVVRAGHDRAAYARAVLESCRHYLQSPLDCLAGASGPDLKTRVETIMTAPLAAPLSPLKKVLLLSAGACAIATPVMAGLVSPEVRKAAAPLVKAVATIASPAHALAPAADNAARQAVVLAQDGRLLAPALAVAPVAAAPQALVRDVAGPRLNLAPAEAARPPEVAAAAPVARAAVRAPAPADPSEAAASFVQTYAAATAKNVVARWIHPICVRVEGLPDQDAGAVKARIEAVAKDVGVKIELAGCGAANIDVRFTKDAQGVLDAFLWTVTGDASNEAQPAKTVTLPIQAWYQTNGMDMAANDTGDLKALADYRPTDEAGLKVLVQCPGVCGGPPITTAGQPTGGFYDSGPVLQPGPNVEGWAGAGTGNAPIYPPNRSAADRSRQFLNAFIIVDARRIPNAKLGPVEDYVAMLALSQSRSLGECQALPSIVDLFANCPGRAAPEGLTAADMAYLHALYSADHTIWAKGRSAVAADVAKAMAPRLSEIKALAIAAPAAAPKKPIHPAAFHEVVPAWSPLLQLASLETSDPRPLARAFVQSNARVSQFGNTRPVQAWRQTVCVWTSCESDLVAEPPITTTVLVDARRTGDVKLNAIADYAAMLVLGRPSRAPPARGRFY